jgi:hypothetical protein
MRPTAYNGESELCHIIFSVLKNLCVHSVDRTVATFEIDGKLSYSARFFIIKEYPITSRYKYGIFPI